MQREKPKQQAALSPPPQYSLPPIQYNAEMLMAELPSAPSAPLPYAASPEYMEDPTYSMPMKEEFGHSLLQEKEAPEEEEKEETPPQPYAPPVSSISLEKSNSNLKKEKEESPSLESQMEEEENIQVEDSAPPAFQFEYYSKEKEENQTIQERTSAVDSLSSLYSSISISEPDLSTFRCRVDVDLNPDEGHPLYQLLVQLLLSEKENNAAKRKLNQNLATQTQHTQQSWSLQPTSTNYTPPPSQLCRCKRNLKAKEITYENMHLLPAQIQALEHVFIEGQHIYSSEVLPSLYAKKISELEVEVFVDSFLSSCSFLSTITAHQLVVIIPEENYQVLTRQEIDQLLELIKIFFFFDREASPEDRSNSPTFFETIHTYILKLSSILLRCGSSTYYHVLLHFMLCTPSFDSYGISLLQFPLYWEDTISESHFLSMLGTVLDANVVSNELEWQVDIVASLLEQFPFQEYFQFISQPDAPIIASLLCLCAVIGPALTYFQFCPKLCTPLAKVVVQAIKHICKVPIQSRTTEVVLLRFILMITQHSNDGIQQFLLALPFDSMRPSFSWKIFYAIYQCSHVSEAQNLESWNSLISNTPELRHSFLRALASNRFLLYPLPMLVVRKEGGDGLLLFSIILTEIFHASLISPMTRESCFKDALTIIPAICIKEPSSILVFLDLLREHVNQLGSGCLKMAEHIPWHLITLTDEIIMVLKGWIYAPKDTLPYFLSCVILERLAYGFNLPSFSSWTEEAHVPCIALEYVGDVIPFMLCDVYIKELNSTTKTMRLRSKLSLDKDPREVLESFCFRVIQKITFFDNLGRPLALMFGRDSKETLFIRNFIGEVSNSRTLFPLYVLLQCSDIGRDLATFQKGGFSLLETFSQKKSTHPVLIRLLHDLIPSLLSQGSLECRNGGIFTRIIKEENLTSAVGFMIAKLIFQVRKESYGQAHVSFWLEQFPAACYTKQKYKWMLNVVSMAASHIQCTTLFQEYLMSSIKGKKTDVFPFFRSFSFEDKLRYPWLGFHLSLAESCKQYGAWKKIISSMASEQKGGPIGVQKAIKMAGKKLTLHQFTINESAQFCAQWRFDVVMGHIGSCGDLSQDPWTPLLLHWQLFIILSSQIVPQDILQLSSCYGWQFLKVIGCSFGVEALVESLNENVLQMDVWLSNASSTSSPMVSIVSSLRKYLLVIAAWIAGEDVASEENNLFCTAVQASSLVSSCSFYELFIGHIVPMSSIYRSLIAACVKGENCTLPSYQLPSCLTQEDPIMLTKKISHIMDERVSQAPPEFQISPPRVVPLPVLSTHLHLNLNYVVKQAHIYKEEIEKQKNYQKQRVQEIHGIYRTVLEPVSVSFTCAWKCGKPPTILSIPIEKRIPNDAGIESLNQMQHKLSVSQRFLDFPDEFCLSSLEIKMTLERLIQFMVEKGEAENLQKSADFLLLQLLDALNEITADFPPARSMLCSSIKSLRFTIEHSQSVLQTYTLLLSNPARCSLLCRDLFFPMINLDCFVPLYELVINRIEENSPETTAYLRSCLNERIWIDSLSLSPHESTSDVRFMEVERMLLIIASTPYKQEEAFSTLATYLFPLFFLPSLTVLLESITVRQVLPETLHQFVSIVENNISLLSSSHAISAASLLSDHLWNVRRCKGSLFMNHWSVFASLFTRLNVCLVQCFYSDAYTRKPSIKNCVEFIESLYMPWVSLVSCEEAVDHSDAIWNQNNQALALPFLHGIQGAFIWIFQRFASVEIECSFSFWQLFVHHLAASSSALHWEAYVDIFPVQPFWNTFHPFPFVCLLQDVLTTFRFDLPPPMVQWLVSVLLRCPFDSLEPKTLLMFYIPLLSLFHVHPFPVEANFIQIMRHYLRYLAWNSNHCAELNLFEKEQLLQVFERYYTTPTIGLQVPGNRINPSLFELASEQSTLPSIFVVEEKLAFSLRYLQQSCAPIYFDGFLDTKKVFTCWFSAFWKYSTFLIKQMDRAAMYRTQGMVEVLCFFYLEHVQLFATSVGAILQFYGSQQLIGYFCSLLRPLEKVTWDSFRKNCVTALAARSSSSGLPFLFHSILLQYTLVSPLSLYCEITLDNYFQRPNVTWNNFIPLFQIPRTLPHSSFQQGCVHNGLGLSLFAYFFSLHKILWNSGTIAPCQDIIKDVWNAISSFRGSHPKRILLSFLFLDQLQMQIATTKQCHPVLKQTVVQFIEHVRICSEDRSGSVLGLGGTPSQLPLEIRLVYKVLFVFLSIQVHTKTGDILIRPVRAAQSCLSSLQNQFKRKEYAIFQRLTPILLQFLPKCEGRHLVDINGLRNLFHHELFRNTLKIHFFTLE